MNRSLIIVTLSLFAVFEATAFVRSRSSLGDKLYWGTSTITMYHDTNFSLTDTGGGQTVSTIASNSANQWNGVSGFNFNLVSSGTGSVNGRNDLYYGTNASYFGSKPALSGVLAVTVVAFETSSGKIVEADVIVNSAKTFSNGTTDTNPGNLSYFFLGDVLTHEFGHVVGLGHSQVKDSSMVYTVYRGQSTTSEDDQSGLYSMFPNSNKGSISGKIVGGSTGVGVFSAHVMAISTTKGKVVSSSFSDVDGTFTVYGLDLNDTYYIYTTPGNVINEYNPTSSPLPGYYSSAKRNFCEGGTSYRGSFFQSCHANDKGFPQGVALSSGSSDVNVGNITIRCTMDLADNYTSDAKNGGLNLNSSVSGRNTVRAADSQIGEAIVGRFSSSDISGRVADVYTLDLTTLSAPTGPQKYLNIKVVSGHVFSPLRVEVDVDDNGVPTTYSPTYDDADGDSTTDSGLTKSATTDQNVHLDHNLKIPLSSTTTENEFTITITPEVINQGLSFPGLASDFEWFFPVSADLMDSQAFYLLLVNVTLADGTVVYQQEYNVSDNTSCYDGPNAYTVTASKSKTTSASKTETIETKGSSQSSILSCGSIAVSTMGGDDDGDPPQGPLSIVIGFIAGMAFLQLSKRSNRFNRLS